MTPLTVALRVVQPRPMVQPMSDMPKIDAYPICNHCNTAFVLRHVIMLTLGRAEWVWMRDCKCRGKIEPVMVTDGDLK